MSHNTCVFIICLGFFLHVVDRIEALISSYGQLIHYHWNKSHQKWYEFKRNNMSIFVTTLDIKSIKALHLCMISPNCYWNQKLKLPWFALGRSKWCTCYKASPNFILWHLGFVVIIWILNTFYQGFHILIWFWCSFHDQQLTWLFCIVGWIHFVNPMI